MNIKVELLKNKIAELIINRLEEINIDADKITDSLATDIIAEIQHVLLNENLNDFEIVDEIVDIFNKNNIQTGKIHDFG